MPIANPFNFDHSGWVVNNRSDGNSTTATGNKDANQTSQTGRTAGLLDGLGLSQPMLIAGAAVVAYVLLKR
ncbi:hypothetical protein [Duganella sp. BJB476]|uniref:hypothetical protein n=1 Tax=Duganella sp. BJB476 TaxID=1871176 RepID=UPI0011C1C98C|nr:hypothetical protein [Duganella sp. BJB476]